MPPDQPPVNNQGTPPQQTSTGEIVDQSLINQDQGTIDSKAGNDANKDQSLLNQDAKQVDDKAKAGDDKAKTDDKAKGPPDKYEFKVPEGYEVTDDVTAAFREAGLTQAAAQ